MQVISLIIAMIILVGCAKTTTTRDGVVYKDKRFKNTHSEEGIQAHKLLRSATPYYSPELRKRGIEGVVVIKHDIDKDGKVENAEVIFSRPENLFDEAALSAAYKWKFSPAMKEDKPIKSLNIVMHTEFCVKNKKIYEYKEPICGNKVALKELQKSIEIPAREYEM